MYFYIFDYGRNLELVNIFILLGKSDTTFLQHKTHKTRFYTFKFLKVFFNVYLSICLIPCQPILAWMSKDQSTRSAEIFAASIDLTNIKNLLFLILTCSHDPLLNVSRLHITLFVCLYRFSSSFFRKTSGRRLEVSF